jgi:hypothetical protein
MKRAAMMMAMAMLASAGLAQAQESVTPGSVSPVQGGKTVKAKTMTAVGAVTTVTGTSLAINDGPGKDWTFVIDPATKIFQSTRHEKVDLAPASPVPGGKEIPGKPAGQETIDVAPASPVPGGKEIPAKKLMIADVKEGQRVQVTYRTVDGKMHATQVRLM